MNIYRNDQSNTVENRLNSLLSEAGLSPISADLAYSFALYLSLLLRWNQRVNLSAIRDEDGILSRHFVESIVCAHALPSDIHTLLDFGSGAGFPGIPIALCRPEISVTLAESQSKKAAFLREAVRVLGIRTKIHSNRAEELHIKFDCVTLRAVDRMDAAVQAASQLVCSDGRLILMTTGRMLTAQMKFFGDKFSWNTTVLLPGSEDRLIAVGLRAV